MSEKSSDDLCNWIQPFVLDNVIVKAKLLTKKKEDGSDCLLNLKADE